MINNLPLPDLYDTYETATMPFSAEVRALLSEAHRELQAARGLFHVQIGPNRYSLPVNGYDWQAIPGMPSLELRAIPPYEWPEDAPPHTDYFYSRGFAGCQQPRLRLASKITVEVLEGSLIYWKESEPERRVYFAGDTFSVESNEEYGFVAREDFLNRVAFSPRITMP